MKRLAVFENLGENLRNHGNDPTKVAELAQKRADRMTETDEHIKLRKEEIYAMGGTEKVVRQRAAHEVAHIAVQAVAEAPVQIHVETPDHHQTAGQH
jgi:hypothetical protein